jgi:hypothetical protein
MRIAAVSVLASIAMLFAACGSGDPPAEKTAPGPALVGFTCGGIVGYSCPPDSACPTCQDADCGTQCYATRACDPATPACADGFTCDPGSRYCVPKRACKTKSECESGQLCVTQSLSTGVCVTVAPGASTPCPTTGTCPFPRQCLASGGGGGGSAAQPQCRLACIGMARECPATMKCVDLFCEPGP